jgi:hypothetical protein
MDLSRTVTALARFEPQAAGVFLLSSCRLPDPRSPNRLRDLEGLEYSRIQESPMKIYASCSRVALKFRSPQVTFL